MSSYRIPPFFVLLYSCADFFELYYFSVVIVTTFSFSPVSLVIFDPVVLLVVWVLLIVCVGQGVGEMASQPTNSIPDGCCKHGNPLGQCPFCKPPSIPTLPQGSYPRPN